jgi:subtilisin family serine protease
VYGGQFGFAAAKGPSGRPVEGKPMKRETDYDDWDGTSMASPHVAAAAALVIAKHGRIGPQACRDLLVKRSDVVAGMGGKDFDSDYGYGRLNLESLLR